MKKKMTTTESAKYAAPKILQGEPIKAIRAALRSRGLSASDLAKALRMARQIADAAWDRIPEPGDLFPWPAGRGGMRCVGVKLDFVSRSKAAVTVRYQRKGRSK